MKAAKSRKGKLKNKAGKTKYNKLNSDRKEEEKWRVKEE